MFRKILFGAVSIAGHGDGRGPGTRPQGIPRRHSWRRERNRPSAQLPVPRRPPEERSLGFEKVSLFPAADYDGVIQGSARRHARFRRAWRVRLRQRLSQGPEGGHPDPHHPADRRLHRLSFDRPGAQVIPASPTSSRPRARSSAIADPGFDLWLSDPADPDPEGHRRFERRPSSRRPSSMAAMRTTSSPFATARSTWPWTIPPASATSRTATPPAPSTRRSPRASIDPDDFVEVWRSALIPNGPLVVRTALGDEMTAKLTDFFTQLPTKDKACFEGVEGGDFTGYVSGEAGLLQRRSSKPVRQRSAADVEIRKGRGSKRRPSLHAPIMTISSTDAFRRATPTRLADALAAPDVLAPALYTLSASACCLSLSSARMWFADEANAGHFFDRLPHICSISSSWLIPKDWNDVWRALFDVASPHDTGTQEFDFPLGRVYVWGGFYIPEYFELMLDHGEHGAGLDLHRLHLCGFLLLLRCAQSDTEPRARLCRQALHGIAARLPGDRHCRPVRGDRLDRPSRRHHRHRPALDRRARQAVLRDRREHRHARRGRPEGGWRQLVRAGALRRAAAGATQFHVLHAASHRDQCARLDHHRRRRRRRHRRGTEALHLRAASAPRRWRWSCCCSRRSSSSTSSPPGCAASWSASRPS